MILTEESELLLYPIGKFSLALPLSDEQVEQYILSIAGLPARLQEAVVDLTPEQLDTPYRDGGWTVRQVIHHLPDSHMNGYIRQKLALTEHLPTIRPYQEGEWAALPDSLQGGGGGFHHFAGCLAPALGAVTQEPAIGATGAEIHSPSKRGTAHPGAHRVICLARRAPPGAHNRTEETERLVSPICCWLLYPENQHHAGLYTSFIYYEI